ncbi:MAG: hypothetical protein HY961_08830 [Ignavibacteriae bacterium]|nr:hypothetical protein [Ignavibacteriota bacterium]
MKMIHFIQIFLLMSLLSLSCKKDSTPSDPGGGGGSGGGTLTEAQKAAIRSGYAAVASTADTVLLSSNPLTGLQSRLATYQANPNVETAWITGNSLFVKFRNGGTMNWTVPSSLAVPPYDSPTGPDSGEPNCLLSPSERVGNTNALLINAQYGDESRQYNRDLITYLAGKFQARGFTVTTKNGSSAGVNFFSAGLKQYGTIFYISHGCYDGTNTWQTTGEEGTLDTLMAKYSALWTSGQLSIGTVTEKRNGTFKAVKLYMFSQKLIDSMYAANDFPKSMIYLIACQGMKNPGRHVAVSFVNKGARGVIGWDETNCLGQSTGKKLFTTLLCGSNLQQAYNALPAEAKLDPCAVQPGAALVYYPSSADTLRLVDSVRARILFTSPKKDSTYTTRNLTLSGSLINGDSIASGIVEINGIATRLTIGSGFRTFSQPIVIDSGANFIHVSMTGKLTDGRCAFVDTTYSVKGSFPALGLWTELRWNTDQTDVDFHLLRPGYIYPSGWFSGADCYYQNRTTSWGAYLDVDDVNGYGPEHITVPMVSDTGTYSLLIHYFSDHGHGPSAASVSVSVRGGATRSFGPYALAATGDVWEVCRIHFPDGLITPVGIKRSGSAFDKSRYVPPYKRWK